jgi:anthranilate phosphoribosyltransferase
MAEALSELGTSRTLVVHGRDGLDEISTTGPTDVFEVTTGAVLKHVWNPADLGLQSTTLDSLKGGDVVRNTQIINEVLSGTPGPKRDIVTVNAGAGLLVAGLAHDLVSGVRLAGQAIDSGAASAKLELLRKYFPIS